MWNGWKPSDLEDLSYEDGLALWEAYQKGIAGPSVDYINQYNTYSMMHQLTQVLIGAHSKNYKPKEAGKFEEVFKTFYDIMTMKATVKANELSLGTQSVLALEGAPEWLSKAAMDEIRGD